MASLQDLIAERDVPPAENFESSATLGRNRASEYLNNIARTQGREPTREEINDAVRIRRKDEGLPENPPHVNKWNSPYVQEGQGNTSPWGERVRDAGGSAKNPQHVDQIPKKPGRALADLLADKAAEQAALDVHPVAQGSPLIATSSRIKTGNPHIDNAGEVRQRQPGIMGISSFPGDTPVPEPDWDSEDGVKAQLAAEGVRLDKGLPFFTRLRQAQASNIPSATAYFMKKQFADLPEGVTPRYDDRIGKWLFPLAITMNDVNSGQEDLNDLGKYRYVAADEEQFSFEDFADMVDPSEALPIIASVLGTGKFGKILNIPFKGMKGMATEATGQGIVGTAGRIAGDTYKILFDIASSDGEWTPTYDELVAKGVNDAQIEFLTGAVGEMGARLFGWGSEMTQRALIRMSGRTPAPFLSADDIDIFNKNMNASREDLELIQGVTGTKDYTMTRGEAMGSINIREMERSHLASASPATRREEELRRVRAANDTSVFIDRELGGRQPNGGIQGVVKEAKEAFSDQNVIVSRVEDLEGNRQRIVFAPKGAPDSGLHVIPKGREGDLQDTWQVVGVNLPDHLRRTGLSDELYINAAREARAHNKRLVSDGNGGVSSDAVKVWERLAKTTDEFKGMVKNKSGTTAQVGQDGRERIYTNDGKPLYELPKTDPLIEEMLTRKNTMNTLDSKTGEIKSRSTIGRMFRGNLAGVNSNIMDEIAANRFQGQKLKEAFLQDYELSVSAINKDTGSRVMDQELFTKWKKETGAFADNVFTPEEMLKMQHAGGLKAVVAESREKMLNLETSLRNEFKLGENFKLSDPGVHDKLYNDWAKMDQLGRRRAMGLLEEAGMADGVRSVLKEDMKNILQGRLTAQSSSMGTARQFGTWVDQNRAIIKDMYPKTPEIAKEYLDSLQTMATVMDRKALTSGLRGTKEEANPSVMAFARVMFGPLSRIQRFLSAGRRLQTRKMGELAIEIISDPKQLKDLVGLMDSPIRSRQAIQVMTRLGIGDALFGIGAEGMSEEDKFEGMMEYLRDIKSAISRDGDTEDNSGLSPPVKGPEFQSQAARN